MRAINSLLLPRVAAANVFPVIPKDFLLRHSVSQKPQDEPDPWPRSFDPRLPKANPGIDVNPVREVAHHFCHPVFVLLVVV
jgi:hypothetical protein